MRIQKLTTAALLAGLLPIAATDWPATLVASTETALPTLEAWPAPEKPLISALPDGRIDIEGVIVDPQARTASLPVRLNLASEWVIDADPQQPRISGEPIEYLLVHVNGKSHESIFTTQVRPWAVHTAMLLLGLPSQPGSAEAALAPETIDDAFLQQADLPVGPPVNVHIEAISAGGAPLASQPATQALAYVSTRHETPSGQPWVYNGSYFIQSAFIAEVDGSFISLITDPAALINLDHPARADDAHWRTNPILKPHGSYRLILSIAPTAKTRTPPIDDRKNDLAQP
ncbi:MAG: YdjY domain-containing protein [Opitutales bacterium]